MSWEAELNGKGGQVCKHAKAGEIQCPLIIRPTSEDVISANVVGLLKHIRPHLWVGPLLNVGLGTSRFRQVWYKGLRVDLWKRVEKYPAELLDFKEGSTEPDIAISWENPPTTLWIEAKYLSPLAGHTANSKTNDQAIRGIRTLLAATGHITTPQLFNRPKRNAVWLALLCSKPEPVVDQYRDRARLMIGIGKPEAVTSLPLAPFVGTITWNDIRDALIHSRRLMSKAEQSISLSLDSYLELKMTQAKTESRHRLVQLQNPSSLEPSQKSSVSLRPPTPARACGTETE
jgi:hypothetical protein